MVSFSKQIAELYPWMKNKAKYYCRVKEDADDLVSETVLRMLLNREKYDESHDLKPWCLVVMKNIYNNWYQRSMTVRFVGLDDMCGLCSTAHMSYNELNEMMSKMSKASLNVYCLDLYIQGYSYEEIGLMLNIKIGTVRSRIFNGRKMLRSMLED